MFDSHPVFFKSGRFARSADPGYDIYLGKEKRAGHSYDIYLGEIPAESIMHMLFFCYYFDLFG